MTSKTFIVTLIAATSIFNLFGQTCDRFVGGYVPSYRNPSTMDFTKISHAFYGFAGTDANGKLIVDAPSAFSAFKTATTGKQRFISLAGGGGAGAFASMTSSTLAIQAFVDTCVAFCSQQNIQGIDVDWEGITDATDSAKYGKLMRALASGLHEKGFSLVATLSYGSYGGDYYNVGALKQADWIQLMVYDQTGTWGASPFGNHSTYQHMLDAIQYWKNRGYTDLSNIVIGLPFYGYEFASASGGLATAKTYSEIVAKYPNLSCATDDKDLTVFNGPATIRQKVSYVIDHGLKGVMIWELGQDLSSDNNKSLLRAVSLAACGEDPACVDVVSATEGDANVGFAFTNPVEDILKIASHSKDIISVSIYDNIGAEILQQRFNGNTRDVVLNVKSMACGIMLLKVGFNDGHKNVVRLIKL